MNIPGRDTTPSVDPPSRLSHDAAESLISARLDGPLDPAANRALLAHLATCPSCRAFSEQMSAMSRGLRDIPQLPASPTVSRQVRERLAAGQPWWSRFSLAAGERVGGLQAAAAMLILIGAVATVLIVQMIGRDNGSGGPATISPPQSPSETARATSTPGDALLLLTQSPSRTQRPDPTATIVNVQFFPTSTPPATETVEVAEEPTETATLEPTATDEPEPTATETEEPSATPTDEPTETPEPTETRTPRPTRTATEEPTEEPTETPEPTETEIPPTETAEPTGTEIPPTETPEPTETEVPPTETPAPTEEPTEEPTDEPTETPKPSRTPSPRPSRTPTETPEPTVTGTPPIVPSNRTPEGGVGSGEATEEVEATEEPTEEPTDEPTEEPTDEPTPEDDTSGTTETGAPTIGPRDGGEPSEPDDDVTPEPEEPTETPEVDDNGGITAAGGDPENQGDPGEETPTEEVTEASTEEPTEEPTDEPTVEDPADSYEDAEVLGELPEALGATTGLRFTPDGAYFAYTDGQTVTLADAEGNQVASLDGSAFVWSPLGGVLLVQSGAEVAIWDRDTGEVSSITGVTQGDEAVIDLAAGWNESSLLFLRTFPDDPGRAELHSADWNGENDSTIWEGTLGDILGQPVATTSGVWVLTDDGWVGLSYDGGENGPFADELGVASDPITSPFGSVVAYVTGDGQLVLASSDNPWIPLGATIPDGGAGFAFSPDGSQVVVANGNGLAIYDLFTGDRVGRIRGGAVAAPGWSSAGIYAVSQGQTPELLRLSPSLAS